MQPFVRSMRNGAIKVVTTTTVTPMEDMADMVATAMEVMVIIMEVSVEDEALDVVDEDLEGLVGYSGESAVDLDRINAKCTNEVD
ncbi:hypothetical protein GCK32_014206 [Trichostrongylus colubriformis]|uniref:Uncharacterized protein n=1 Tax=Trichostrongylus colubriformis TaxID=6319 RepID=A0AAN8F7T3_TRICO